MSECAQGRGLCVRHPAHCVFAGASRRSRANFNPHAPRARSRCQEQVPNAVLLIAINPSAWPPGPALIGNVSAACLGASAGDPAGAPRHDLSHRRSHSARRRLVHRGVMALAHPTAADNDKRHTLLQFRVRSVQEDEADG